MDLGDLKKLSNEELLELYNNNHAFVDYLEDLKEQIEKEIDNDE